MLSFNFVIGCGLFDWKRIYADFCICIAVGDPVMKRGGGVHLIGLPPPPSWPIFVKTLTRPGFPTSYVVV
jgi:hypothetical protein